MREMLMCQIQGRRTFMQGLQWDDLNWREWKPSGTPCKITATRVGHAFWTILAYYIPKKFHNLEVLPDNVLNWTSCPTKSNKPSHPRRWLCHRRLHPFHWCSFEAWCASNRGRHGGRSGSILVAQPGCENGPVSKPNRVWQRESNGFLCGQEVENKCTCLV